MGSRPPPGCWVLKQGPSPRPGRRMAQEAFEAYSKSSPLPALPHHPFAPGYVPPPVSMGIGGSRHGTLSTMRRRGDYRQGATAAGDPGVRSLNHGEGRESPKEKPPPPGCSQVPQPVLASCLRRACDMRATKGRRHGRPPPPPHTPPPPQGWGMQVGGGEKRPPPKDKAAGWGGSGERVRDGTHDRARREHAPGKPQRGDHRGCERKVERATTGATRHAPPPAEGQVPRLVPASCLRRACDMRATKGRRQDTPPHTHLRPPKGGG